MSVIILLLIDDYGSLGNAVNSALTDGFSGTSIKLRHNLMQFSLFDWVVTMPASCWQSDSTVFTYH